MSEIENKTTIGEVTPKTGTTGYTFSAEAQDEFELIPNGTYETTLEAEKASAKNGSEILKLKFRIRKDIDQKYQNRLVFETLFKDKSNDQWFDIKRLNKILLTQKEPKLKFNDVDECIQYINGLNMKIDIETYLDDYSQKDRNRVKFMSYAMSDKPVSEDATLVGASVDTKDIPDDDLPF